MLLRTPLLLRTGLLLATLVLLVAGSARADAPSHWHITPLSDTNVAPGGEFTYVVQVDNGDERYGDNSEMRVRARLAPGLTFAGPAHVGEEISEEDAVFSCDATPGVS